MFQLNERYEAELVKMNRDLENYRVRVMTLTRKQEDYAHLFDVFDHKLSVMSKHVDKSQMKVGFSNLFHQLLYLVSLLKKIKVCWTLKI